MPQAIESPVASPRASGYKVGDEVTMYGHTFRVVGTREDGSPILDMQAAPKGTVDPSSSGFSYQGSVDNFPGTPPSELVKPKKPAPLSMELLRSKRERIASLPPEIREVVIDRLFDKVVGPKIPKNFADDQKAAMKKSFTQYFSGEKQTPMDLKPTEADYKKAGFNTGLGGRVKTGVLTGMANLDEFLSKIVNLGSSKDPAFADLHAQQKDTQENLRGTASALSTASAPYAERHPTKSAIAEFTGASLPAMPFTSGLGEAFPALKGAPLLTKILTGAARGGVTGAAEGPAVFSPDIKGVGQGAAWGAGGGALFSTLGAGLRKLVGTGSGMLSKTATTAAEKLPGAAGSSTSSIEDAAERLFGKKLKDLTAEQKIDLIGKWNSENKAAQTVTKAAEKKAAADAKVAAATAKASSKVDQQVAVRRAMDEAKALQKQIREFVKTNKRAPTDEELTKLREQARNTPAAAVSPSAPASTAPAAPPSGANLSESGTFSAEPPKPGFGTAVKPAEEQFTAEQIAALKEQQVNPFVKQAREMMPEGTSVEDIAKKAAELQGAAFKVESPEAVKAVQAVADISKIVSEAKPPTPEVKVVPEGVHGKGDIGRRAKDAERVAAARAKAKAEQPEPVAGETPETILAAKEEEFLKLTDAIEAMGAKGKEAAKNLYKFQKGGKVTMDQAIEMGNKVLEVLKKGTIQ